MRFGDVITALEDGYVATREGWNGKEMYIYLIYKWSGASVAGNVPAQLKHQPFICMKTAQNTVVPWLASQSDILAEDWYAYMLSN